jgi:PGF-CTERM protein
MISKKLFSAVLATLVILSIVAGSTVAFAQTATPTFLGLPGFEAVYGVVGLLAVAYLVMRRRN